MKKEEVKGEKPEHPKVVMLDMSKDAVEVIEKKGYTVSTGSLGRPYKIEKTSSYVPFRLNHTLPNYREQDILIVDFAKHPLQSKATGDEGAARGSTEFYAKGSLGVIDPRTRVAYGISEELTKAFDFGMAVIIFIDSDIGHQTIVGTKGYHGPEDAREFDGRIWNLFEPLNGFNVDNAGGELLTPVDSSSALGRLVTKHLKGAEYRCTIGPPYHLRESWRPLAVNRYGQAAAGLLLANKNSPLILLPRFIDQAAFLSELFEDVLPELVPAMFPDAAHQSWVNGPEYELADVLSIVQQKKDVVAKAQEELSNLDASIEKVRARDGWLHDLITGTDDVLVSAVSRALQDLGFQKIRDVDEERDKEGKSRREDLQVHDIDHVLVVDVKGVAGGTADNYALQADKHATLRDKEWRKGGPDYHPTIDNVTGLAIINHQRHLPPLDRENEMPFRQEMLDTADEHGTGLLTTWDLYRLVRNKQRWGWPPGQVTQLLYGKGRILPIPAHYTAIGHIVKAWTDKFGIVLGADELHVGDTIAIEFPILFEEVAVESIHVEDANVTIAKRGDQVGLLWPFKERKLREGMTVYIVGSGRGHHAPEGQ